MISNLGTPWPSLLARHVVLGGVSAAFAEAARSFPKPVYVMIVGRHAGATGTAVPNGATAIVKSAGALPTSTAIASAGRFWL